MDKRDWQDMVRGIEAYVDAHDTKSVLEALEEICYGKAEHVRENWQDEGLGEQWDNLAGVIGTALARAKSIPCASR